MSDSTTRHHVDLDALKGIEFCWEPLKLEGHGVSFVRLPAGKGYQFWHRHDSQEEVYICLEGECTLIVEEQEFVLKRGDCLKVAPEPQRIVGNRGSESTLVLVTGALPLSDRPQKDGARSLIQDGQPDKERELPDWSVRS